MTLATDLARQHWAAALDASREAVLVIVGWAALAIVLSADRSSAATAQPGGGNNNGGSSSSSSSANANANSGGTAGTTLPPAEPTPDTESVEEAQWRVHRLRARLVELAAARERAGSGADPDLDREFASTTARLEHARQWLTSAQSALAVSRHERGQVGRPVDRPAGNSTGRLGPVVAEQAADHQGQQPVLLVRVGGRRPGRHDEAVDQREDVSSLHALSCLAGVLRPVQELLSPAPQDHAALGYERCIPSDRRHQRGAQVVLGPTECDECA